MISVILVGVLSNLKLNKVDAHIIHTLRKDARVHFSEIAKMCGVTTDTISKRFNKLKNTGVIKRTTVLLNPRSFGINYIADLSVDIEGDCLLPHLRSVEMFINELPEVVFCTPTMGKHNVFAIATCRDLMQLNTLKERIKNHPLVRQATTNIWVHDPPPTHAVPPQKMVHIDRIDLAIIQTMTKNARTSFRKTAKELGISPDTVMNRYKKLRKNRVIIGSTVIIDPTKLGYTAMVAFLIGVASPQTHETKGNNSTSMVLDNVISMPSILLATKILGTQDILAIGMSRGFEHLIQLNNDIAMISGIQNIEISFWDILMSRRTIRRQIELCPKYLGI